MFCDPTGCRIFARWIVRSQELKQRRSSSFLKQTDMAETRVQERAKKKKKESQTEKEKKEENEWKKRGAAVRFAGRAGS